MACAPSCLRRGGGTIQRSKIGFSDARRRQCCSQPGSYCPHGAFGVSAAWAQDANGLGDAKAFTVNANFQAQVPVDAAATTADLTKAIAQANQALGELANRECDVLGCFVQSQLQPVQLNMVANVNDRRRVNNFDGNQRMVGANLMRRLLLRRQPSPSWPLDNSGCILGPWEQ